MNKINMRLDKINKAVNLKPATPASTHRGRRPNVRFGSGLVLYRIGAVGYPPVIEPSPA